MPTNTSLLRPTPYLVPAPRADSYAALFGKTRQAHAPCVFQSAKTHALSVFVLILLACALLPSLSAQQQSGHFTYIREGSSITIIDYTGPGGAVTIPGTIAGSPVRTIGDGAFLEKVSLTGVTIPNNVTLIGYDAFLGCESLASVSMGSGVTAIQDMAFHGCIKLTKITLPNSVSTIGVGVFDGCKSLASATIPSSVKSIGDYAFNDCISLASVTLPGSISEMGSFVFSGCTGLASVIIGDGTKVIGEGQFLGCTKLEKVTIPGSVVSINDYAFFECSRLNNVVFSGNAPSSFGSDVFGETAPGFVIHYKKGASGFTSPTWKGYPAVVPGEPVLPTLAEWRKQHFGASATNAGDAADTADPDRDGFNNAQEYAAGTNPRNAASFFKVHTADKTATSYTVTFEAQPYRSYELQRLLLTPGAVWQRVTTREPQITQSVVSLNDAAAPPGAALYRVRVTAP